VTVEEDAHPLNRGHAFAHHFINGREKRVHLILYIDDLDHDRQVRRELQEPRGVDDAVRAVTLDPAQNGGPGEPLLSRRLDQRQVERLAVPVVALTEEDPQKDSFSSRLHLLSLQGHDRSVGQRKRDEAGGQAQAHIEGGLHWIALAQVLPTFISER